MRGPWLYPLRGALIVAVFAQPLGAAALTLVLSGTITGVNDPDDVLAGSVTVGEAWSATIVIDESSPDSEPDPTLGFYYSGDETTFPFTIQLANHTVTPTVGMGVQFEVRNELSETINWSMFPVQGLPGFDTDAAIRLFRHLGGALDDDTIAGVSWDLAEWPEAVLELSTFTDESAAFINGSVDSLAVVPEPATSLLLALGGLQLARCARARARRAGGGL
jgi:hypothetical protein